MNKSPPRWKTNLCPFHILVIQPAVNLAMSELVGSPTNPYSAVFLERGWRRPGLVLLFRIRPGTSTDRVLRLHSGTQLS
jgi:hypothetical protein